MTIMPQDADDASITTLISTLDQRKVESITRTFKMVSRLSLVLRVLACSQYWLHNANCCLPT